MTDEVQEVLFDLGARARRLEADVEDALANAASVPQDGRESEATSGTSSPASSPQAAKGAGDRPLILEAKTVEWGTPRPLVRRYAELWADGDFDLDVAASAALHVCPTYYTVEDDGLALPWRGRVWCNPPYGRVEELWVRKAVREVYAGRAELVAMLLPAKTGKVWFQELLAGPSPTGTLRLRYPCAALDFLKGRVRYVRPDGTPGDVAGFASVGILIKAWPLGDLSADGRARPRARRRAPLPQLPLFGPGPGTSSPPELVGPDGKALERSLPADSI
jgi:hypothetical protein